MPFARGTARWRDQKVRRRRWRRDYEMVENEAIPGGQEDRFVFAYSELSGG